MMHTQQTLPTKIMVYATSLAAVITVATAGCSLKASYIRENYEIYQTEDIISKPKEAVWQAALSVMSSFPIKVRDQDSGLLETEWFFGHSDVTRQVVRTRAGNYPIWLTRSYHSDSFMDRERRGSFAHSAQDFDYGEMTDNVPDSSYVKTRQKITVNIETAGKDTIVRVHQKVFENRPIKKGGRDHFVEVASSTKLEHRILQEIQRALR